MPILSLNLTSQQAALLEQFVQSPQFIEQSVVIEEADRQARRERLRQLTEESDARVRQRKEEITALEAKRPSLLRRLQTTWQAYEAASVAITTADLQIRVLQSQNSDEEGKLAVAARPLADERIAAAIADNSRRLEELRRGGIFTDKGATDGILWARYTNARGFRAVHDARVRAHQRLCALQCRYVEDVPGAIEAVLAQIPTEMLNQMERV